VYKLTRTTKEVEVNLEINSSREININSGNGFFDHLLSSLFFYSGFGVNLIVKGDLETGFHHSAEDIGITLGQLLNEMLQKSDYQRYSQIYSPMDESLILIVSDISNRPFLSYDINFDMPQIANFPLELIEEFILALVNNAKITMHIKMINGKNNHHKAEAIFKGIGRTLAIHFKQSFQGVQSTKGMLI